MKFEKMKLILNKFYLCRPEIKVVVISCILFYRVIGTPEVACWPKDVSIPHSSVGNNPAVPLETVVPEICAMGRSLLQVKSD